MKGAPVDYVILVVYFMGILRFGTLFGRFTRSTKGLLAGAALLTAVMHLGLSDARLEGVQA